MHSRVATPLASAGERGQVLVPAFGQLAVLHAIELLRQLGILGPVLATPGEPGVAKLLATLAETVAKVVVNPIRYVEFGVFRPAVVPLGQSDFFLAKRLAVGSAGVLFVRGTVGDMAVHDDQRRGGRGVSGRCGRPWPSIS